MKQSQGLSDLDELLFNVRDPESRKLLGEALAAYRGGALRSALVAIWIAVAYDIIAKARELGAQNEKVPKSFVTELDAAIASQNVPKLQKIESSLLERANTDFQFFAPHEYSDLSRLNSDRNLCAHPAFVSQDNLFQPSPELVRTHLVHAIQHLLCHAPLQGKAAAERLQIEMSRPSFPITEGEIEVFLKQRYLDRAKDSLVVGLLGSLISCPFGAEHEQYAGIARQIALAIAVIGRVKPAIYEAEMPNRIEKKTQAATDEQLLNAVRIIGADPRIWSWMSSSDQIRLKKLVTASADAQIKKYDLFDGIQHPQLNPILLERFKKLSPTWQQTIISDNPNREFSNLALLLFAGAGSFRHAEALAQHVLIPMLPFFDAADIEAILTTAQDNGQINEAGDMPELFNQVYDGTIRLLPETGDCWNTFVDLRAGHTSSHERYGYPGIRERLVAAGLRSR